MLERYPEWLTFDFQEDFGAAVKSAESMYRDRVIEMDRDRFEIVDIRMSG